MQMYWMVAPHAICLDRFYNVMDSFETTHFQSSMITPAEENLLEYWYRIQGKYMAEKQMLAHPAR